MFKKLIIKGAGIGTLKLDCNNVDGLKAAKELFNAIIDHAIARAERHPSASVMDTVKGLSKTIKGAVSYDKK